MTSPNRELHFKAVRMLLTTTLLWGLSFPIVKALSALQGRLLPETNVLFHAGLTGVVRFGAAGLVMMFLCLRTWRNFTRKEFAQGVGLGIFGGVGILLQMDGLSHTSASISAFLTQTFCIYVPIWVALRDRQKPTWLVIASTLVMVAGVALLNMVDFKSIKLGRGEWETILAALFFSGQIMWVEKRSYALNDVNHFSLIMFWVMALLSAPIMFYAMESTQDILVCYSHPGVWILSGLLILFCTIFAFVMMNRWQKFVPATEAAIIYGAEPVWASIMALFLPGLISMIVAIHYPNEKLTWNLLSGGALIIFSNLMLQVKWTTPLARTPEV